MTEIVHNVTRVQERIAEAALRVGRDPAEVTLVAVAKTFPAEAVVAAYQAGVRHFGENRVEEGMTKIPAVHAAISGPRPTWHMVGHVQSRKAKAVVAHFDYVHSVDRLKIARRLSRFAQEAGRTLPVLLECNVSGEETKFGFDLQDWEHDEPRREAFFAAVEEILALPALSVQGLMTMAPFVTDPETVRPVFASLRGLLDALRSRFPTHKWRHLSMGMTDDFEVAVEEGATMVRIGRALFGARQG
ncbi:MAG: YggS family pyridoxal phosphate-dependent enzyme [Chloroflexi bacterium]|nr:MAG: YggS family pyridoxal phosphate-dependent enzyme [Chloroflexota bacterium]HEY66876.1 YggS family pyridoxal phosphate-dependent enzyme [Thermoflexia bacterium]